MSLCSLKDRLLLMACLGNGPPDGLGAAERSLLLKLLTGDGEPPDGAAAMALTDAQRAALLALLAAMPVADRSALIHLLAEMDRYCPGDAARLVKAFQALSCTAEQLSRLVRLMSLLADEPRQQCLAVVAGIERKAALLRLLDLGDGGPFAAKRGVVTARAEPLGREELVALLHILSAQPPPRRDQLVEVLLALALQEQCAFFRLLRWLTDAQNSAFIQIAYGMHRVPARPSSVGADGQKVPATAQLAAPALVQLFMELPDKDQVRLERLYNGSTTALSRLSRGSLTALSRPSDGSLTALQRPLQRPSNNALRRSRCACSQRSTRWSAPTQARPRSGRGSCAP
jgi:hypothetical protein